MEKELKNYIGQKFSKLTVIGEADRQIGPKGVKLRAFVCQCECGRTKVMRRTHLGYKGKVMSCGKCGLGRKLDKPVSQVTYDEAKDIVLKVNSIKEFKDTYPALYIYINKNGWHNKIFSHLPRLKGRRRSDDEIKEIISQYKTYSDFKNKDRVIHDYLKRNKLSHFFIGLEGYTPILTDAAVGEYYDICKDINKTAEHFGILRNTVINKLRRIDHPDIPKSYLLHLTEEDVIAEARKYNNRKDFYTLSKQHYVYAIKNGILDKVFEHLEPLVRYDKDQVTLIAKKYKNKREFSEHASGAAAWAQKHGIYDEICSHMEKLGNRKAKMVYAYEFVKENAVYVGLSYRPKYRDNDHRSQTNSAVYKFGVKAGYIPDMKILTDDYVDPEEANRLEEYYLNEYVKNGWKPLNIAKTGQQGQRSKYDYYTDEQFLEITLKYTKRKAMQKSKDASVYRYIKENGKEYLFDHMIVCKETWDEGKIIKEAKKYNYRTEFARGCRGAYDAALHRGILDNVCSHMVSDFIFHTEESIKEVVSNYTTVKDFYTNSPKEYQWISKKKELYEKLCGHLIKMKSVMKTNVEISIDGKIYSSYSKAVKATGKSMSYIHRRVQHKDYPNYYVKQRSTNM
jgi:hypothetical protein